VANPLVMAATLYKKLLCADLSVREQIDPFLRAIKDDGVIPLGLRRGADGRTAEYCWLVFDPGSFATEAALLRRLKARTPDGARLVIIRL